MLEHWLTGGLSVIGSNGYRLLETTTGPWINLPLMSRHLRPYRTTALLVVFTLISSAFAPLSAACGMEFDEGSEQTEAPAEPPCHSSEGQPAEAPSSHHEMPTSHDEGDSGVHIALPCCTTTGIEATPTTATTLPRVAVAELPGIERQSEDNDWGAIVSADESPPRQSTISKHILFGCFLT